MRFEASDLESMSSESHLLHNDPPKGAEKQKVRAKEREMNQMKDQMQQLKAMMHELQRMSEEQKIVSEQNEQRFQHQVTRIEQGDTKIEQQDTKIEKITSELAELQHQQHACVDFEFRTTLADYYRDQAIAALKQGEYPVPESYTLTSIWKICSPASHSASTPPVTPLDRPSPEADAALWDWIKSLPKEDLAVIAYIMSDFDTHRLRRNQLSHPVANKAGLIEYFSVNFEASLGEEVRKAMVERISGTPMSFSKFAFPDFPASSN